MSPQDRDTAADEHKSNPQPPSVVDKHSSSENKEQTGDREEDNSSDIKTIRKFFWREPITGQWFFNGVVALFTVLTCYVTYLQYTAQLLDQRAWVGVKELHLAEVPTADKRIAFVVEVWNTGKTPGLNVTIRIKFSMDPPSDLRSIDLLGRNMGNYIVPPGTGSYPSIVVFPGDRVLTEEEVAVLRKRKTPLYLYGLINYDDIFGEPHWTRYCGVYLHNDISPMALNWCDQKGYNAMQ